MNYLKPTALVISVIILFCVESNAYNIKSVDAPPKSRAGKSFYTEPLHDQKAIYLTPDNFPVTPDKDGDDSEALQQAINKAEEQSSFGIVMIPEGSYQFTKTVYVWSGIRLIGYGKNRPVFVLEENTPGFSEGENKYLVHFASGRPDEGKPVRDANPGTFYSAISNINFDIKNGNPSAVAVRSHFAQHCYIAHVDFNIGSGKAGVEEVGNEIDDCNFIGGEYGIITTKPSPSWPFLMIDCYFEGQTKAAISTEEGGLTLVRNYFKNVPGAIVVNPDRAEELFLTDSRFENISGPAIIISDEYNARPQFNLKNVVCIDVPVLASFRKSKKEIKAPGKIYLVKDFSHGLQIEDPYKTSEVKTLYDITPLDKIPDLVKTDIPDLPDCKSWVNLSELGAKGDGLTDDTEILKQAVAKHNAIYLPTGRYLIKETIELKPNTVLIGLNPITTQIVLADKTPMFLGTGSPVPMVAAPKGGNNIITGIGLDPGAFNERVVAAKWMAGSSSMMNDVRFIGGHGTYNADGSRVKLYNDFYTGDPFKDRDWDSQYWSLWITDGGGGTFKDIWTPNTFAQAGIYISNTSTPGRIYAMSVEHHVRNEVILRNVSNWKIYDLQMEEEGSESPNALPLRIEHCSNIIFANLYLYRVIRMISPYPNAVVINSSKDIEFNGIHVYSPGKFSFNNTIYDQSNNYQIREREIARLKISGHPPKKNDIINKSSVIAPGAEVEKAAGGFEFIDGAAVDNTGNIYFTDSRWKHIYRWTHEDQELSLIRELLVTPAALAFDLSGNLLVTTNRGQVVTFHPDSTEENIEVLEPVHPGQHNGVVALLPGHRWRDEHDFLTITTYSSENPPVTHSSYTEYLLNFQKDSFDPLKEHFVSRDGHTFIPQSEDLRRAYSLREAVPGYPYFMADEFGQKTYKFSVNKDGSLSKPELFAERGELDVAVDDKGNVYIPAGNIFVYDKSGKFIEEIKVPERPACVLFGGKNNSTLYITARSSLYKVETTNQGRVIRINENEK
ncbi:MAG: glycosyl hydrolase family 28-related protein [Ignavibacteriaceae bacterium]